VKCEEGGSEIGRGGMRREGNEKGEGVRRVIERERESESFQERNK